MTCEIAAAATATAAAAAVAAAAATTAKTSTRRRRGKKPTKKGRVAQHGPKLRLHTAAESGQIDTGRDFLSDESFDCSSLRCNGRQIRSMHPSAPSCTIHNVHLALAPQQRAQRRARPASAAARSARRGRPRVAAWAWIGRKTLVHSVGSGRWRLSPAKPQHLQLLANASAAG